MRSFLEVIVRDVQQRSSTRPVTAMIDHENDDRGENKF